MKNRIYTEIYVVNVCRLEADWIPRTAVPETGRWSGSDALVFSL